MPDVLAHALGMVLAHGAAVAQHFVDAVRQGQQLCVGQRLDQIDQFTPQRAERRVGQAALKALGLGSHGVIGSFMLCRLRLEEEMSQSGRVFPAIVLNGPCGWTQP